MLIRNTLSYLPAQILGPAAQFAAILVFTHWMAPDAYGIFTYVLVSQDFVFLLCLSWWSQYTVRYIGTHAADADDSYHRSESTIIVATIALQIFAVFVALSLVSSAISARLALAAILYVVTRCLTLHLGERARARHKIFDYTLAQSAGPIFGFVTAFLAVAFIDATPEVALFGYGVTQALILVALTLRQDIGYALHRPDKILVRRALGFGLPLIAAGLAAWFGMNAIRILVDHRMGAAAMGLIAVGWGLGNRLTATAAMLVTVAAYPLAVESLRVGSRGQAFSQITLNGLLMFGIILPATVGLYLLQGPLVALLVAKPFQEMTLAVLPAALAAGLFRNVRTHVVDQVYMLIERTNMVCVMSVLEAVLVIIGCLIGLTSDGAVGAAIGCAAGYGLAMIVAFAVVCTSIDLHIPWRGVACVVVAVAVMAAALWLVPNSYGSSKAILVVAGKTLLGVATYCVALLILFPTIPRVAMAKLGLSSRA